MNDAVIVITFELHFALVDKKRIRSYDDGRNSFCSVVKPDYGLTHYLIWIFYSVLINVFAREYLSVNRESTTFLGFSVANKISFPWTPRVVRPPVWLYFCHNPNSENISIYRVARCISSRPS